MDDPLPFTPVVQLVAGLLILILGRRLFWIFVGVVGFFFGVQFGASIFAGTAGWIILLVSVLAGIVCAGLTILLQRLAVAVAGGFAGGMIAFHLAPLVGLHTSDGQGAAFIAGGLLAAVLLSVLFDPALILLSSITGAFMIADALPLDDLIEPVAIGILVIIGIAVQIKLGSSETRRPKI